MRRGLLDALVPAPCLDGILARDELLDDRDHPRVVKGLTEQRVEDGRSVDLACRKARLEVRVPVCLEVKRAARRVEERDIGRVRQLCHDVDVWVFSEDCLYHEDRVRVDHRVELALLARVEVVPLLVGENDSGLCLSNASSGKVLAVESAPFDVVELREKGCVR